ncbi:VOC family protein [Microbacteriaceae bacterium 4G12]
MQVSFHHAAIEVRDLFQSALFYQDAFGFQVKEQLHVLGEDLLFLTLEKFQLELIACKEATRNNTHTHLAFQVTHLDILMNKMEKMNVPIAEGPYELENGWRTVFYYGPDKELLEVMELPY